jgi:hypothetical protein
MCIRLPCGQGSCFWMNKCKKGLLNARLQTHNTERPIMTGRSRARIRLRFNTPTQVPCSVLQKYDHATIALPLLVNVPKKAGAFRLPLNPKKLRPSFEHFDKLRVREQAQDLATAAQHDGAKCEATAEQCVGGWFGDHGAVHSVIVDRPSLTRMIGTKSVKSNSKTTGLVCKRC